MRVAVIGSTSFLGKNFLSTLSEIDEVIAFSRSETECFNTKAKIKWQHFDLDSSSASEIIECLLPMDAVIYCVASGVQPKNKDTESQIWNANCFFPLQLLEQLNLANYQGKLVTFGSYFELGKANESRLLNEEEFLSCRSSMPNAYCASKKNFSDYVSIKHQSELTFVHLHAVLTNIYGVGENENRLIPYIFDSVLKEKPLGFSSGIQKRQYTHIRDVANWLRSVVSMDLLPTNTGVYHVTDDKVVTVREVIEEALSFLKKKGHDVSNVSFKEIQKRDSAMLYLGVSSEKAEKELNWKTDVSLAQGLSEYYESN